MCSIVSTYRVVHQERELLARMDALIQQREDEYMADLNKQNSSFEFEKELKAMITNCEEVQQIVCAIMSSDEVG